MLGDWYVLNPDLQVYIGHLAVGTVQEVRVGAAARVLPPGLGAAAGIPVYRFRVTPSPAQRQRFMDQAE